MGEMQQPEGRPPRIRELRELCEQNHDREKTDEDADEGG